LRDCVIGRLGFDELCGLPGKSDRQSAGIQPVRGDPGRTGV
jgi:hypothetical protein